MKIVFLCPEYPPYPHGGVGVFTRDLARQLVAAGHAVRVVGVYPTSDVGAGSEVDAGVEVFRIPTPPGRFGWIAARWRQLQTVRRWIREGSVDLVESPDCYGWFAGWPALPVPLVLRAHGSLRYYAAELGQTVPGVISRLEGWSHRRADAWVAVSRHTGEVTRRAFGLASGPDAVIYNAVPIPASIGPFAARERFHVAYSGTLTAKKGIVSLFRAWPAVRAAVPDARLHVYGKDQTRSEGGTMTSYLMGLLPEADRGSVVFHGHVTRAALVEALGRTGAAVFPSYTEAYALAPVEAMACGVPTVYTKRSSGPEVVRHDVDGLLVDPDAPAEISEAILAILRDPERARRLSEGGRRRAMDLSDPDTLRRQNEAFYEELVRRHRAGEPARAA